jgi:lambda repressor-like predicted transcriptional regulator
MTITFSLPTSDGKTMDTLEKQTVGINFLRAYMECSDEIQKLVKELINEVILSDESDSDEKQMAMFSVADALFPNPHKGFHGMDLLESEIEASAQEPELAKIVADMDAEELSFSERLRAVLVENGMTQQELADAVGLGQSAIANILSRDCRPQQRTVRKIAEALGVQPSELWPAFSG